MVLVKFVWVSWKGRNLNIGVTELGVMCWYFLGVLFQCALAVVCLWYSRFRFMDCSM